MDVKLMMMMMMMMMSPKQNKKIENLSYTGPAIYACSQLISLNLKLHIFIILNFLAHNLLFFGTEFCASIAASYCACDSISSYLITCFH